MNPHPAAAHLPNGPEAPPLAIECPQCQMISCHQMDVREGYCGKCRAWTAGRVMSLDEARAIKDQRRAAHGEMLLDRLVRDILG